MFAGSKGLKVPPPPSSSSRPCNAYLCHVSLLKVTWWWPREIWIHRNLDFPPDQDLQHHHPCRRIIAITQSPIMRMVQYFSAPLQPPSSLSLWSQIANSFVQKICLPSPDNSILLYLSIFLCSSDLSTLFTQSDVNWSGIIFDTSVPSFSLVGWIGCNKKAFSPDQSDVKWAGKVD